MLHKSFAGISLGAVLLIGIAVFGVYTMLFTMHTSPVKMKDDAPTAENENSRIHGQIIYDQRIALPPQAILVVQLAEHEHTNSSQKIIAEIRSTITGQMPVNFTLPATIAQLDKNYSHTLQAKISVGDALWFVNETPMPVEPERAGYLIHLTAVERSNSETIDRNHLKGREWVAQDILNNGIIDNTHITMHIDNVAKDVENHYSVSGSGGCNRYFTTATLNEADNTLKFEPLDMTFMVCAEAILSQEAQFVDMMTKVKTYRINPVRLLDLLDENHNPLARFAPAD